MAQSVMIAGAARPSLRLRRPGAWAGTAALACLIAGVCLMVLGGSAGAVLFAPHPFDRFPDWLSGPLAHVLSRSVVTRFATKGAYSALLAAMFAAYLLAVACARKLRPAHIVAFVMISAGVLFLGPPTRLNDVFNYLGYARLGAVHHLNPYTHVIWDERGDPIIPFTSWRNLSSPYGPLFTALTYPLAKLSLPAAFWAYKACAILADLCLVWLVSRCARALGHDWRAPVLFIAANPLYLCFEVAGFHNDFFMLVPATAAILLVLQRRDAGAGAVLMLAVAVKFTAVILAPFLLVAATTRRRRTRLVVGMVFGALPMIGLSLALFGTSLPNLSDQAGLVTGYSVPNLIGLVFGLGGATPVLVRGLEVAVVLCVLWRLRGTDWITSAGGCTLALIASIAWLMPWYLVWVLPLAALSKSRLLRAAAVLATLFLLVTFAPAAGLWLQRQGVNPLDTPFDRSAQVLDKRLQADYRVARRRGPGGREHWVRVNRHPLGPPNPRRPA